MKLKTEIIGTALLLTVLLADCIGQNGQDLETADDQKKAVESCEKVYTTYIQK